MLKLTMRLEFSVLSLRICLLTASFLSVSYPPNALSQDTPSLSSKDTLQAVTGFTNKAKSIGTSPCKENDPVIIDPDPCKPSTVDRCNDPGLYQDPSQNVSMPFPTLKQEIDDLSPGILNYKKDPSWLDVVRYKYCLAQGMTPNQRLTSQSHIEEQPSTGILPVETSQTSNKTCNDDDQFRREQALKHGLPQDSCYSDINKATSEEYRLKLAREKGLPDNASFADMNNLDSEKDRVKSARELGLPDSASWADMNNLTSEKDRLQKAHELGLPDYATWGDINDASTAKKARELGLPDNTTWSDLERIQAARNVGLPDTASWQQIMAKLPKH